MALREARVWGAKERLIERAAPLIADSALAHLLAAAHICDGLVKGLRHPDWPQDGWDALKRLALMTLQHTAALPCAARQARRWRCRPERLTAFDPAGRIECASVAARPIDDVLERAPLAQRVHVARRGDRGSVCAATCGNTVIAGCRQ